MRHASGLSGRGTRVSLRATYRRALTRATGLQLLRERQLQNPALNSSLLRPDSLQRVGLAPKIEKIVSS